MSCPLCNGLRSVPVPHGDFLEGVVAETCPLCYPPPPRKQGRLYLAWRRFLAFWRLDMEAVCQMSCGDRDYHDYCDSTHGQPDHFVTLQCKRCGKDFFI